MKPQESLVNRQPNTPAFPAGLEKFDDQAYDRALLGATVAHHEAAAELQAAAEDNPDAFREATHTHFQNTMDETEKLLYG